MEKLILDIAGMLNEKIAIVEYDRAIVTASDIAKAVNDLGYIATAGR